MMVFLFATHNLSNYYIQAISQIATSNCNVLTIHTQTITDINHHKLAKSKLNNSKQMSMVPLCVPFALHIWKE